MNLAVQYPKLLWTGGALRFDDVHGSFDTHERGRHYAERHTLPSGKHITINSVTEPQLVLDDRYEIQLYLPGTVHENDAHDIFDSEDGTDDLITEIVNFYNDMYCKTTARTRRRAFL